MHESMRCSLWLSAAALAAVLALFGALMRGYYVDAYEGVDENGYMVTAKRLATAGETGKRTTDSYEFVSGNWVQTGEQLYQAKYSLGYPWLCALAYRLGGPPAAFLVNPILAALAVAGIFFLGRAMAGNFIGALAAILLATNSLHGYYGLLAASHAGAICFAVWGMFFIWRWSERGGWFNALLGAVCCAYACAVRYTEGLLALPIAGMIAWRWGSRRIWRDALVMGAGALVVVAPLLAHHAAAFGAPWITGYALCGETAGFGWRWFAKNGWLMLTRMNDAGLYLIFPIGMAGLLYLALHNLRRATLLGLWAVPGILLYTAYYWAPQGEAMGYIRFFVSLFPPLILSGLMMLESAGRGHRWWPAALGVFVAVAAAANLRETTRTLERQADRLQFAKATQEIIRDRVPENAVLLGGRRIHEFMEYFGNYRLVALETFERSGVTRALRGLRQDGPHPFHRPKAEAISRQLGDKTEAQLAELQRQFIAEQLAAGRFVALVGPKDLYRRWRGRFQNRFQFVTLAEWIEAKRGPNDQPRQTEWALYSLKLRPKMTRQEDIAALEERIDELQFRARALRMELEERFPGSTTSWTKVTDLEREIRELQDQLKRKTAPARAQAKGAKP
jgi:polyhydroxyalkanoate synthesis regulator phasin